MPPARVEPSASLADRLAAGSPSLQACWDYLKQIFCLASFFGIGLVVSPICGLLHRLLGSRVPPSAGQCLIRGLFRGWLCFCCKIGIFEIRIEGGGRLKELRRTIVAPNHPSLVDAVILLSIVPRTVCIMRASLAESPVYGGPARLAGFVPNDKGSALIRQGVEKLEAGENLLIFPEGTRTGAQAINSFKKGFALIAKKAGAPIQTIFIEHEGRYLSKGVSLFCPSQLPIRFRLHVGKIFQPETGQSAQDLSVRLEGYFREHLQNNGEDIRLLQPS